MKVKRKVNEILVGDALAVLKGLPDESAQCCVTSPPYWGLRDYGVNGQIGLEKTPEEYVTRMVTLFGEVRRVLRVDGTLWLNLGDSYARSPEKGEKFRGKSKEYLSHNHDRMTGPDVPNGLKSKDLIGIPWRVAFALQADGWYLRSDIIWSKPNPMPESVTDRPTKAHEYLFLMSKSERYYYDGDAIREPYKPESMGRYAYSLDGTAPTARQPDNGDVDRRKREARTRDPNPKGRNRRTVWDIPTSPFPEAHFAVFPEKLIEPCILAGCPEGGVVLDPFMGSGTTALVALKAKRQFLGIELNPEYAQMAEARIWNEKHQARLI